MTLNAISTLVILIILVYLGIVFAIAYWPVKENHNDGNS